MSELYQRLRDDIKTSMKARDSHTTTILRGVDASIKKIEIDENREITDELVFQVLKKSVKNLEGANAQFTEGGRQDLVEANNAEITILEKYLPKMITGDELTALVKDVIAQSGATCKKEMGKIMGILKAHPQASLIDFGQASKTIQSNLG